MLNLGSEVEKPNEWSEDAALSLRSVSVGSLQDLASSWELKPGKLDIDGFRYFEIGGYGARSGDTIADRRITWLMQWLGKQHESEKHFTPQPFDQLYTILSKSGQPSKAVEILYEKGNQQRLSPDTSLSTKIWLTVNWALIGYGYKEWRALVYLFALIVLGTVLLSIEKVGRQYTLLQRVIFNFDIAIPIINFNPKRTEEILTNLSMSLETYFHIQKVLGFIFVTFAAAGLSGLIQ